MFQDWKGAIHKCLLEEPVPTETFDGRAHPIFQNVEDWISCCDKSKDAPIFCIKLNHLHEEFRVCSDFAPNPFQKERCKNCLHMKENHFERRKGGVLCHARLKELSRLGIQSSSVEPPAMSLSKKDLFYKLQKTVQFAHHTARQMRKVCHQKIPDASCAFWYRCHLVGPLRMTEGKAMAAVTTRIGTEYYNGYGYSWETADAVECTLDDLRRGPFGV
jgi:hypothetical protein